MVAIFITLFVDGTKAVQKRDSNLLNFYNSVVLGLIVLWTCYPIVWALGEGKNIITSDTEVRLHCKSISFPLSPLAVCGQCFV